jgi:hypothetical protein
MGSNLTPEARGALLFLQALAIHDLSDKKWAYCLLNRLAQAKKKKRRLSNLLRAMHLSARIVLREANPVQCAKVEILYKLLYK